MQSSKVVFSSFDTSAYSFQSNTLLMNNGLMGYVKNLKEIKAALKASRACSYCFLDGKPAACCHFVVATRGNNAMWRDS